MFIISTLGLKVAQVAAYITAVMVFKSFDSIFSRIIVFFGNITAFYLKVIYSTLKTKTKDFFQNIFIVFKELKFFFLYCIFSGTWKKGPVISNLVYAEAILEVRLFYSF